MVGTKGVHFAAPPDACTAALQAVGGLHTPNRTGLLGGSRRAAPERLNAAAPAGSSQRSCQHADEAGSLKCRSWHFPLLLALGGHYRL